MEYTMPIPPVSGSPFLVGTTLAGLLMLSSTTVRADQPPVEVPASPEAAAPSSNPLEPRVRELEDTVRQLQDALRRIQDEKRDPAAVQKIIDDRLKQQKPAAGFDNGFYVQSPDGSFRLRLRALLHADSRAFTSGSGRTGTDSFYLRRARPILEGTLYKYFDFRLVPDFGEGRTVLQDAYLDVKYLPEAVFRAGRFKEPFSLERLQSASDLWFVERSIAQNLAPNRDVGVMLHGELFKGVLGYQAAAFNGVDDGGSSDIDLGNDKDFVGRVFAQPFRTREGSFFQGLGVGVAGTAGKREEGLSGVTFRTSGRSPFFRYTSSATGGGDHWRFSPQFYFFRGPFGLMGEYVSSNQEARLGDASAELNNKGWFLQGAYVLTGEKASYRGVTPDKPFDPKVGQWGAFELAARYSKVDFDRQAFRLGLADPLSSASEAKEFTFGVNWYLNRAIKFQLNYVRTNFDRGIRFGSDERDHEDLFMSRFQVAF
jgi:phosphate-selective porin OprO and OprP